MLSLVRCAFSLHHFCQLQAKKPLEVEEDDETIETLGSKEVADSAQLFEEDDKCIAGNCMFFAYFF